MKGWDRRTGRINRRVQTEVDFLHNNTVSADGHRWKQNIPAPGGSMTTRGPRYARRPATTRGSGIARGRPTRQGSATVRASMGSTVGLGVHDLGSDYSSNFDTHNGYHVTHYSSAQVPSSTINQPRPMYQPVTTSLLMASNDVHDPVLNRSTWGGQPRQPFYDSYTFYR